MKQIALWRGKNMQTGNEYRKPQSRLCKSVLHKGQESGEGKK